MYDAFHYPAFLRGFIVAELPVIIDNAIVRTISKYGSLVNEIATFNHNLEC
ncbi:hypothetical protein [Exiguobacterium artemiae]|uniref:hypothetical protein n=1 Tax=Exiguobacterium artemiae TaxID=340145 RepID=UPI00296414ED|nr:hypothetical protein [Exiguobacterium sibiricum]MDW2886695.1 hypothetical protein [Exiguobacterium sibiricum]